MASQLLSWVLFALRYYANEGHRGSHSNTLDKMSEESPRDVLNQDDASHIRTAAAQDSFANSGGCVFVSGSVQDAVSYSTGISTELFKSRFSRGPQRN